MNMSDDDEEGVRGGRSTPEPPMIIGGFVDVERLRQIVAGENRRRAECHAGLRPWLIAPRADPRVPLGIAGSTPEEAQQLANFEAATERRRAAGWPDDPEVRFPRNGPDRASNP